MSAASGEVDAAVFFHVGVDTAQAGALVRCNPAGTVVVAAGVWSFDDGIEDGGVVVADLHYRKEAGAVHCGGADKLATRSEGDGGACRWYQWFVDHIEAVDVEAAGGLECGRYGSGV